jgi:hypothetical protein
LVKERREVIVALLGLLRVQRKDLDWCALKSSSWLVCLGSISEIMDVIEGVLVYDIVKIASKGI